MLMVIISQILLAIRILDTDVYDMETIYNETGHRLDDILYR